MKKLIIIAALFTGNFLSAKSAAIEIQTFATSCAETANGSVYIRAESTNWNMYVYRNAMLLNTISVAGADTFLSGLAKGSYTFVYNTSNGNSAIIHKIVAAPDPVVAAYVIENNTNSTVAFTNYSTGAFAFDWDFGDGIHSAEISPTHTYTLPGRYTVTLNAYNRAGCANTMTYTVNVFPNVQTGLRSNANTPAVLFVSGDGSAVISATGTKTISQIFVYSITGQVIYSGTGNVNSFTYDTPGIYTARILYDDGEQESKNIPLK